MYFKRIEMHGFKSFADPVTIEFDQGITCVVGPNGSGKSNISDAVRWVLGEQSPKMLRGSRMEDVIFAGTTGRKSRGMAEVTFVLDNSTGILPIEFNEVAITRKMYRSGESEYFINNSPCRMKDIRELLMDTGIGVDGYSLIGQGKISEIISNKTESIREIFEETAGIVSYRTKKHESEKRMTSARSNLERVSDIIGEIEGRIDSLKEESEKAKEYLTLRERYKTLEINIILNTLKSIEVKNETLKKDRETLEKALEENLEKQEEYKGFEEEGNRELSVLEEKLSHRQNALMSKIQEIRDIEKEVEITLSKKEALEASGKRLEKELKETIERRENQIEITAREKEKKDLIGEIIEDIKEVLEEKLQVRERSVENLNNLKEKIGAGQDDLLKKSSEIAELREERGSLEALKTNLSVSYEELMAEKLSGEENREKKKSEFEELSYVYQEILEEKNGIEEDTEEEERKLFKLRKDDRDIHSRIQKHHIEISDLNSRYKTINEMESNYEGYTAGVRFIMKRNIKGLHGVVGELINPPSKYALALETALGGGLQNIICADENTAGKAVEELKANRSGRATFLPLTSIKPRKSGGMEEISKKEGFLTNAVEAADFDEKYRKAIEYLLGGVAVFDNIRNALAAVKGKISHPKLVTLEGEIINSSGAVTGGRYRNDTANLLSRRGELKVLRDKIKILEKEGELLKKEEQTVTEQLRDKVEKLEYLRKEHREKSEKVNLYAQDMGVVRAQLQESEAQDEKIKKQLKEIKEESSKIDELLKELAKKSRGMEETTMTLRDEAEIAQDELSLLEGEVSETESELTKLKIALAEKEGERDGQENLIKHSQRQLKNLDSEIIQKEEAIEGIKYKIKNFNIEEETEKLIRKAEEEKAGLENVIGKLKEEESSLKIKIKEASEEKNQLLKDHGSMSNRKFDIELKLTKHETQEENLKEKLWEEFEISYIEALSLKEENFAISKGIRENREIKARFKEMGNVNVGAVEEYEKVSQRYEFLCIQRKDIEESMGELKKIIEDLDKVIRRRFKEGFNKVVTNFRKIFRELFGGGDADITIDESEDILEGPMDIIAQPPGKQLKNINLLSGGEKTMTAIALMFAVLKTKPTPCCILDEVEAALDDKNIDIFAHYLRKFKDVQFTLITHQKNTMEHADALYGVTMPERGVSQIYSLKLGQEGIERFTE